MTAKDAMKGSTKCLRIPQALATVKSVFASKQTKGRKCFTPSFQSLWHQQKELHTLTPCLCTYWNGHRNLTLN